jgi:hypothetical protein
MLESITTGINNHGLVIVLGIFHPQNEEYSSSPLLSARIQHPTRSSTTQYRGRK